MLLKRFPENNALLVLCLALLLVACGDDGSRRLTDKSDAGSQLPLEAFEPLVADLIKFRNLYLEASA